MTRKNSSKTAVFVSDIHVGSSVAVCHPDFLYNSDNDMTLEPNKVQKKLYDAWLQCLDKLTKQPTVLGINGEPIDGDNIKQIGNQSWSTNLNDQVKNAVELVKTIKGENIVCTRGSGYHVQKGATNFDEIVARDLNAKRYRAYYGEEAVLDDNDKKAALTDYFALFKIHGKLFNMSHHIGFSKNEMYRTTGLAREMVTVKLAQANYHRFDVLVRSHVHYNVHVRFPHSFGVTTPAWKLPDGHLFRGGMGGTASDIGMVEFIVESNGHIIYEPYIIDVDIKPLIREF